MSIFDQLRNLGGCEGGKAIYFSFKRTTQLINSYKPSRKLRSDTISKLRIFFPHLNVGKIRYKTRARLPANYYQSSGDTYAMTFGYTIYWRGRFNQFDPQDFVEFIHEVVHVDQVRRLGGEMAFGCRYGEGYLQGGGNLPDYMVTHGRTGRYERNPLEAEAYRFDAKFRDSNGVVMPDTLKPPRGLPFILETGTALHETDDTWAFTVAKVNRDRRPDLVAIRKKNTGTNSTEVHVLSGRSQFQTYLRQTGTPLHETDENWEFAMGDYNRDGHPDLFAIQKSGATTNSTRVHILSGSSGYQRWLDQPGTPLHETDFNWTFNVADYNGDGFPDLFAIQKSGDATNKTRVHILSGSSGYQRWIEQPRTLLHETNHNWDFVIGDFNVDGYPDLVAIAKSNTGTNSTEVHILSGRSKYLNWLYEVGTALDETDNTWAFAMDDYNLDGYPDLFAIKKSNTGSNSTEVHIMSTR